VSQAVPGPPGTARRRARLLLAAAVSGLGLALAFRGADLGRVTATVASARWGYLLLAVPVDLAVFLAKALKWRLILLPVRRTPVPALYAAIAVGALVANVLPFRLDELVRAFFLGRKQGIPRPTVLGTILVERIVDLGMLLLVATGLVLAFGTPGFLGALLWLALLALGVATLVAGLLAARPRLVAWASRYAPESLAGRGLGVLEGLVRGLEVFPRGGRGAAVLLLAVLEWTLTVRYMMLVLLAFSVPLAPSRALLLVTAGYLSFAIPAAPGGLGVFELLAKGSLVGGAHVEPSAALGMALVLHLLLVVPISLIGAGCLVREGLRLSSLRGLDGAASRA
jgi:glycosyltransferase 2 family protein